MTTKTCPRENMHALQSPHDVSLRIIALGRWTSWADIYNVFYT